MLSSVVLTILLSGLMQADKPARNPATGHAADFSVVAEPTSFYKAHASLLVGSPDSVASRLEAQLKAERFTPILIEGKTVYFAEEIWQGERFKKAQLMLEKLMNSLGSDHFLRLAGDQEASELVLSFLRGFDLAPSDNAEVALDYQFTYTVSIGEEQRTFKGIPLLQSKIQGALADHPWKGTGHTKPTTTGAEEYLLSWPQDFHVQSFGKAYARAVDCSAIHAGAITALGQHFADYWKLLREIRARLFKKLSGAQDDAYNQRQYSQLPPDIQADIRGYVDTHRSEFGIGDGRDSLNNALDKLTVTGATPTLFLALHEDGAGGPSGLGRYWQLP